VNNTWKNGSCPKRRWPEDQKIGRNTKVLGLRWVDSSVSSLLHEAIGKNLIAVLVDTGLLRKNEAFLKWKLWFEISLE